MVDKESKKVVNLSVWNGVDPWTPPDNIILIKSDTAKIGDIWNGKIFVEPEQK